jgi:hypothetical protein
MFVFLGWVIGARCEVSGKMESDTHGVFPRIEWFAVIEPHLFVYAFFA